MPRRATPSAAHARPRWIATIRRAELEGRRDEVGEEGRAAPWWRSEGPAGVLDDVGPAHQRARPSPRRCRVSVTLGRAGLARAPAQGREHLVGRAVVRVVDHAVEQRTEGALAAAADGIDQDRRLQGAGGGELRVGVVDRAAPGDQMLHVDARDGGHRAATRRSTSRLQRRVDEARDAAGAHAPSAAAPDPDGGRPARAARTDRPHADRAHARGQGHRQRAGAPRATSRPRDDAAVALHLDAAGPRSQPDRDVRRSDGRARDDRRRRGRGLRDHAWVARRPSRCPGRRRCTARRARGGVSRRPISCSRVVSTRAPEAPIGWPEGDRAAVHVGAVRIETEPPAHGQRLRRERLVELDQVDVGQRDAGPRRARPCTAPDRPEAHHRRARRRPRRSRGSSASTGEPSLACGAPRSITTVAAAPSLMPGTMPAVTVPSAVEGRAQARERLERCCRAAGTRRAPPTTASPRRGGHAHRRRSRRRTRRR